MVKILFGIPNEGKTEAEAYDNRMLLCSHFGMIQAMSHHGLNEYDGHKYDIPKDVEYQFHYFTIGNTFPALAREILASEAVQRGMDYLFMVDDDMLVMPDLFERLIKHNVDVVAALAFTRHHPHKPVIYRVNKGFDKKAKKDYFVNSVVTDYPKDELVQCDAVGFGAVLIKVDVFRGMPKDWFMSTCPAGEDILFCHNAGKHGFKIFMDTATKITHLGYRLKIDESTYLACKEESNVG